jgi:hypothetical protein
LQSRTLFSHCCGDELVYARPIFLALPLHRLFSERGNRRE